MTKKMKIFSLTLISIASLTPFFVTPTVKKAVSNTIWYENLESNKFKVRNQSVIRVENNGDLEIKPINNNFELKLLLNPGFETDNEYFINKFNNEFIEKVNKNKLRYKSFNSLTMMPVVWFFFESENDRENFVSIIKDWNQIFKFIVFKNNIQNNEARVIHDFERMVSSSTSPKRNVYVYGGYGIDANFEQYKLDVLKNADIVNAKDHLNNSYVNKIGIVESWAYPFDSKYKEYFRNGIELNEFTNNYDPESKTHSTMVSMIAAGQYGIDRSSKVYLYSMIDDNQWMSTIEKMVKNDCIKLINHSYGPWMSYVNKTGNTIENEKYFNGYNENAYFLDYISRKYGVINVFSAGNNGTNGKHLIADKKLSLNSVVVGALSNYATKKYVKYNSVAYYSNYKLREDLLNLSKPLVVAPALFYNPVYNTNAYYDGTSYAAPVVTGLISNLMKYRHDIRNSNFRVPIVKAILSASGVTPQRSDLKYKTSGYEQKFGSGIVYFKAMLDAANNYSVVTSNLSKYKDHVFTSKQIQLEKGQKIKISSSWMFNAGILNQKESRPWARNWWNSFLSWFSPTWSAAEQKWDSEHKNENQLSLVGVKNRSYNNLVTNYDLRLEKLASDGTWHIIREVKERLTNDELIEYKVIDSGIYRYSITKPGYYPDSNSIDDLIAVTHVARNEND